MLGTGDHRTVGPCPEGQNQLIVGQFTALSGGTQVDHPTLQVDALNRRLDETRGPQKGTDREAAVAQFKGSGKDLKQQWRHEQEVVPAHQNDLDVRVVFEEPFQVAGRVDSAKAAAEDHNAFHRFPHQTLSPAVSRARRPAAFSSLPPPPLGDFRHVVAVLVDVVLVFDKLLAERLLEVRRPSAQLRQPVDHVHDQVAAVQVVQNHHVERSRGRAFFLVAAHVQVLVVRAAVGQAMDQPGVAVEREDDRLVLREETVEVLVAQAVRVFARWLELHQIHNVDHADFQFREVLAEQVHRGEGLQRRHVAAARHDDIGLATLVVAGPIPDADAGRAMLDRLVHGQPLRSQLLAGHDQVDVVAGCAGSGRSRSEACWRLAASKRG